MSIDSNALATLIAKDEIRELAMLYSRAVDRKDPALLRTLYTKDATDKHGDTFDGNADAFVDFVESAFQYLQYSGHHICNHLISVNGNEGDGEVYAIAYHLLPDGQGGWQEDIMCVRYIDNYLKDEDGRWRFSKRVVAYDFHSQRPATAPDLSKTQVVDPSFSELKSRLFARGERT